MTVNREQFEDVMNTIRPFEEKMFRECPELEGFLPRLCITPEELEKKAKEKGW